MSTLFQNNYYKVLQSVPGRESFTHFKIIVTNCGRYYSETEFITKCEKCYKVGKSLQSETQHL